MRRSPPGCRPKGFQDLQPAPLLNWVSFGCWRRSPHYGMTVAQAKAVLPRLKKSHRLSLEFFTDGHDISHLPGWAKSPKQTADGHLLALAKANHSVLATLDQRIPGAYLIS